MSSYVCKILFKSEQICGCCCKMLRGSLFLGTHGRLGSVRDHCLQFDSDSLRSSEACRCWHATKVIGEQLRPIHRTGSVYDAFELCISLVAETFKKRRIFAPQRFYTDATVDPPPARDWRRADWRTACRCLTTPLSRFCFPCFETRPGCVISLVVISGVA